MSNKTKTQYLIDVLDISIRSFRKKIFMDKMDDSYVQIRGSYRELIKSRAALYEWPQELETPNSFRRFKPDDKTPWRMAKYAVDVTRTVYNKYDYVSLNSACSSLMEIINKESKWNTDEFQKDLQEAVLQEPVFSYGKICTAIKHIEDELKDRRQGKHIRRFRRSMKWAGKQLKKSPIV